MTLQNEKFEELISQQLARELEPQRGRAAAAFKAQMAAEAAERAQAERQARQIAGGSKNQASWARKQVSGRSLLFWTGLPSLVAAALAVVVTLHFIGPGVRTINPDHPIVQNDGPLAGGNHNSGSLLNPADNIHGPDGVNIVNDYRIIQNVQPQTYAPGQYINPADRAFNLSELPPGSPPPTLQPQ